MPVTPSQFKEEYAEFAGASDALVQAKLDEAYLRVGEPWGPFRDVGAKKLAAHLLWISPLTEPSDRTSPEDTSSDYLRDFEKLEATARVGFFGTVADSGYGYAAGGTYAGTNPDRLTSVFGRVGDVLANFADYAGSLIFNDSAVPGSHVKAALEWLQTSISNMAAGLLQLGNAVPVAVGITGDVGNSPFASPLNHRHAHGDLPGGTLHGAADNTNAGFQSPAHFTKLEELPEAATLAGDLGDLDAAIDLLSVRRVGNLTALSALDLPAGSVVFVETVRDSYLARASALAINGTVIVSHPNALLRWERQLLPHASWIAQAVWEINSAFSVENDGLTPATAIPYHEFLRRRCGPALTFRIAAGATIDVNVNADMPISDPLVWAPIVDAGGKARLNGLPTMVFSGTVSAKTDLSTAGAGNCADVTSTWTVATHLNRLIRDVTNNRWAFVAKDLGGGKARISPWVAVNEAVGGASQTATILNTTVGASLEVYTLPTVAAAVVFASGDAGGHVVNKLNFTAAGGAAVGVFEARATRINWQNCLFTGANLTAGTHGFNNCCSTIVPPDTIATTSIILSAGLWTAGFGNTAKPIGQLWDLSNHVLFQGANFAAYRNGMGRIRNVFFEDVAAGVYNGACMSADQGATLICASGTTVCGNNNAANKVRLNSSCKLQGGISVPFTTSFKLASSGNDLVLVTATTAFPINPATRLPAAAAIALTFANLDAAYSGGAGFGGVVWEPLLNAWAGP